MTDTADKPLSPDPGQLPRRKAADLPKPLPFTFRNSLKTIGSPSMQPLHWRQLAIVLAAVFCGVVSMLGLSSWVEPHLPANWSDLIIGSVIVAIVCIGCFTTGVLTGGKLSRGGSTLVAVLVLAGIVWFVFQGSEWPIWSYFWPFSNLLFVMNFLPYGLSLLAGLTWATSRGTAARRSLPVGAAIFLAGFALFRPLLGTTPTCHNQWKGDVCLQSSLSTCSAACAATLLKAHGIDVQESDMAAACLTHKGTSWQGLFRGLCLKTQGTPWVVEVSSPSWDALEATAEHPVIIDVGILSAENVPKIYTEDYGWQVGQLHSVAYYGERPNNRVAIAEPTPGVGREEWTRDDLKVLYRGRCYRLIPR